jgi:hypothetical protein
MNTDMSVNRRILTSVQRVPIDAGAAPVIDTA